VLGLLGYDVQTFEASISSDTFSVNVARGCDASEPAALFVAAMVAFPAPLVLKSAGIVFGLSMLVVLNIIRIVSLFMVGVHIPRLFHTMHTEGWQVVFIVISVLLFSLWLLWATRIGARRNVRA
jgi:exosortase/archaeosortase family protein